jgi:putative toxin-antitoxin system antitoxin component (TIGR02293 family)
MHTAIKQHAALVSGDGLQGTDVLSKVVRLLGGERILKHAIVTKLDSHLVITERFPNDVLNNLISNVPELKDPSFLRMALGVSVWTTQRKNSRGLVLTAEQSSKAWNFAEVLTPAEAVYGSRHAAMRWLNECALALDGKRPIALLSTSAGNEVVKDLLIKLEYGVYA